MPLAATDTGVNCLLKVGTCLSKLDREERDIFTCGTEETTE